MKAFEAAEKPPGTGKVCLTLHSDREDYPTVLIRLFPFYLT